MGASTLNKDSINRESFEIEVNKDSFNNNVAFEKDMVKADGMQPVLEDVDQLYVVSYN